MSDPSRSHGLRSHLAQPLNSFLTYRSSGGYRLTLLAYHHHGWLPITWPTSLPSTWPLTCMHLLPGEGYGLQPFHTGITYPIQFFSVNDFFFLFTGGQLDMFSSFVFKHFSPWESEYKYRTPNTIAVYFNFHHMENSQLPQHNTVYSSRQVITVKL